jgi:hypothetical protein
MTSRFPIQGFFLSILLVLVPTPLRGRAVVEIVGTTVDPSAASWSLGAWWGFFSSSQSTI